MIATRRCATMSVPGPGPRSISPSNCLAICNSSLRRPRAPARVVQPLRSRPAANVIPMLQAEGSRAPQPVQRWLTIISKGTSAGARRRRQGGGEGGLRRPRWAGLVVRGGGEWAVSVHPRRGGGGIPLDDFTKLFAPGGKLDAYFKAQIAPFVDMSGRTWRLQSVADVPPPISSTDLAQFQRAASIRDLFFGSGSLAVHFEIAPEFLDTAAKQATLDLSGTTVVYAHGPIRGTQVNWPGQGMSDIRLSFDPSPPGGGVIETQGPWALFRFFDQGTMSPGISPEQFLIGLCFWPAPDALPHPCRVRSKPLRCRHIARIPMPHAQINAGGDWGGRHCSPNLRLLGKIAVPRRFRRHRTLEACCFCLG